LKVARSPLPPGELGLNLSCPRIARLKRATSLRRLPRGDSVVSGLKPNTKAPGAQRPTKPQCLRTGASGRSRRRGRVPYLTRYLSRVPLNSLADQESRSRGVHGRSHPPRRRPPRRFSGAGCLAMAPGEQSPGAAGWALWVTGGSPHLLKNEQQETPTRWGTLNS
jgi:hypothetical protein